MTSNDYVALLVPALLATVGRVLRGGKSSWKYMVGSLCTSAAVTGLVYGLIVWSVGSVDQHAILLAIGAFCGLFTDDIVARIHSEYEKRFGPSQVH